MDILGGALAAGETFVAGGIEVNQGSAYKEVAA